MLQLLGFVGRSAPACKAHALSSFDTAAIRIIAVCASNGRRTDCTNSCTNFCGKPREALQAQAAIALLFSITWIFHFAGLRPEIRLLTEGLQVRVLPEEP